MQKWEYCRVEGGKNAVFFKPDGTEERVSFKTQAAAFATLGREGWELVCIEGGFWFKRPLQK